MAWLSGNKVIEHELRVLIFSIIFVWNYSYSQKNWTRYLSEMWNKNLHVSYLLFLSDFNSTWIFLAVFEKYVSNFMRIQDGPSGCTDRWTDRQADTHDEPNRQYNECQIWVILYLVFCVEILRHLVTSQLGPLCVASKCCNSLPHLGKCAS